jgi:hypothetical protein
MSVQEQLNKYAKEEGSFEGPRFPEGDTEGMAELEGIMQSVPVPGQSLTQDPSNRLPHETAPKYTDLQEFIDESFLLISDPEKLPMLLDSMRKKVPVEYIAQKFLMAAVTKGQINTDLMMSAIEPIIYTLIAMATYGGVDPVLYPEDEMEDEDPSSLSLMKKTTQDMVLPKEPEERLTVEDLQAPVVTPRSLLARAKTATENIGEANVTTQS